jgi:molybdopterin/thiamine biosynthesis adenylyltransferase
MRDQLAELDTGVPIGDALRTALLAFNTFDETETARHRQRMRVILQTAELQAYSMTMYAGWRAVVAAFVARRLGVSAGDLVPQTVAWTMLGVALSAYEQWLANESVSLAQALGDAFDTDDCDTCAEQGVLVAFTAPVGSFGTLMTIRAIVGIGDDIAASLFLFDGARLDWRKIRLPKDPNCRTCSD